MKKFKKFILSTVAVASALAMSVSAAGSGKTEITADNTDAKPGDVINVTVSIKENPGIITFAADVDYNSSVFEVVDGSLKVDGIMADVASKAAKAGKVVVDTGDDVAEANTTATGKVATFQLKVKDEVSTGNYTVAISSTEAYDVDMDTVSFDTPSVSIKVTGNKCDHQLTKTDAVPATCETAGSKEYWTCSLCGNKYADAEATTIIADADIVVKALGHDWDLENAVVTKPATCTEKGQRTVVCKRDSSHTEVQDIEALGHDWDLENAVVTKPATCTEKGQRTVVCKRDSSHTEIQDIEALGHDWDEENAKVIKQASATEKGQKEVVCKRDSTHTKIVEFELIKEDTPLVVDLKVPDDATDEVKESVGKAIASMEKALPSGYEKTNTEFLDIAPMVSLDDGKTYVSVTEATMPKDGIDVTLAYPAGLTGDGYDYVVLQVLSDGTVEQITPTETAAGLAITVKKVGTYFAISYKKTPAPAPANNKKTETVSSNNTAATGNANGTNGTVVAPKTADSIPVLPIVGTVVVFAVAGGCFFMKKRTK